MENEFRPSGYKSGGGRCQFVVKNAATSNSNLLRAFAAACLILRLIALAWLLRPMETTVTPELN